MSSQLFKDGKSVLEFLAALCGVSTSFFAAAYWFEFEVVQVWVTVAAAIASATLGFVIGHRWNASAPTDENDIDVAGPVRFGDTIKLLHASSRNALHSHIENYRHDGTSGQQQVTCYDGSDSNDYWLVKPGHGLNDSRGAVVTNGSRIRLEHRNTRRNLHSHVGRPSPLSGQQEVTAFGNDGIGDTNDDWRVDLDQPFWSPGRDVRLTHERTNAALHSSPGLGDDRYTAGQQEVSGFSNRDQNDIWIAVVVARANIKWLSSAQ